MEFHLTNLQQKSFGVDLKAFWFMAGSSSAARATPWHSDPATLSTMHHMHRSLTVAMFSVCFHLSVTVCCVL